jgi:hypothetical protein
MATIDGVAHPDPQRLVDGPVHRRAPMVGLRLTSGAGWGSSAGAVLVVDTRRPAPTRHMA